ncbi:type II secretion system F family protein [Geomonas sp.]|uniref:type II secretion system F family protein n=1 Tax=Geomonas sp. TaxID=2651584 RepID=UPI002B4A0EBD|nr:type II secretion system F family protein [Geomonas sp.]HJV35012.1 type II secretion system F family protein [Geomonas sp.]
MIYLITALVFVSILLLSLTALHHFVLKRSVLTQRLQGLATERTAKQKKPVESGTWSYKLSRIGEKLKLPEREHSKYMKMMVAAGYRKESVYAFFGCKILLTCLIPACYLLIYAVPRQICFTSQSLLVTVICLIAGYLLPSYWLYSKKRSRQVQIFHTLPDILDLVTVCVEAGLSVDAALMRSTETPQFNGNALAQEIRIANMETRAGKPRIDALKDMAERTMVEDVKSLTSMMAQTERFGTSLSQALRTHADSLRTKRRQMAEEAAAKTTIKMIFPLILFIFPALLVVILGPAMLQIGRIFK